MGLQPRRPLDSMLDPTKEDVGVGNLTTFAIGDQTSSVQATERVEGARRPHARLLAAPNELQRLHEKLRLANTSVSELEIARWIAGELGSAARNEPDELRGNGRIDVTRIDEGRELIQRGPPELETARHRSRSQERSSLP